MLRIRHPFAMFACVTALVPAAACSSSSSGTTPAPDSGAPLDSGVDASSVDGGDAGGVACAGPCPASKVKYLVIVVQENHTFDDHFGAYCKAAAGSNPTCNDGPNCCEAAPAKDPSGASPVTLDDAAMGAHDPDHTLRCETAEMDTGKMDMYVTGANCSNAGNFAIAAAGVMQPMWDLAAGGALADRWFQPVIGQSASNDMFFARAQWVFDDNVYSPQGAIGSMCGLAFNFKSYTDKTIGDLLNTASVPWSWYMEGYKTMSDAVAANTCPNAPPDCAAMLSTYPCTFAPDDNPFEYYDSTRDKPDHIRDYTKLAADLAAGTLPAITFVKAIGYRSEHPGQQDKLTDGIAFAKSVVGAIEASKYANDTLVVVTYDEGGGYFDHVKPPATNTVDNKPYGTRVPAIALGPFAKKNFVSHVTLEHSSLVKFIEWNWLGMQTGQLMGRDTNVANIGSLLDASATGVKVPE
jgi:phospholipase C